MVLELCANELTKNFTSPAVVVKFQIVDVSSTTYKSALDKLLDSDMFAVKLIVATIQS